MVCFSGGCLASALATLWYVAVLAEREPLWPFPSEIAQIEALFAVWGLIMFATFYRRPRPIWVPLFGVDDARVKRARVLLACSAANCAAWLAANVGLWIARMRGPLPWTFCLLASAAAILNGVYVAIHWAVRPEKLFSDRVRRLADDPTVFLIIGPLIKRWRVR